MSELFRATVATVDLAKLKHNFSLFKNAFRDSTYICPMIKANGYGHGDVQVAKALEQVGASALGVALIEEGIVVRESGIQLPILHFGIFNSAAEAKAIIQHRLTPVFSTWEHLRSFASVAPDGYSVQIKFDTGMHRLGFSAEHVSQLVSFFSTSKLRLQAILTHLHSGEDANLLDGMSSEQLKLFQQIENAFSGFKIFSHTLNSSGCLHFSKMQSQDVLANGISTRQGLRPGLAIYGPSPIDSSPLDLKPVMTVTTKTVKYQYLHKGQGVSYNITWKAPKDSVVAVLPMGYADGYHRLSSNKTQVLYRGKRVNVVGTVCMDYFLIDVTDCVAAGSVESLAHETVVILGEDEFGNQVLAEELAKKVGTIPWEILTTVGQRVPRRYIESSKQR